jgi:lipoate-protein ligase B
MSGSRRIGPRHATISRVTKEILVVRCGLVPYEEALVAQRWLQNARQEGEVSDVLLLLEHPPVYTRGRRSTDEELPMQRQWYEMQGIEVHDTDRGGRVTYHGPGQLVAYPIVSLKPYGDDVHEYVRRLERVTIEGLAEHGVAARTIEGLTGVWTEGEAPGPEAGVDAARKIGSIGVHVSRGVTTHGLAINVNNDLQPFEWIVPCGLEGVRMTSVIKERRDPAPGAMKTFRPAMTRAFAAEFAAEPRQVTLQELEAARVPSG